MALLKQKGLALREVPFGDSDCYLTVLCEDGRKIEVLCKNMRRGKQAASAQPFCYAEFCISAGRERYTLREADIIYRFWNITQRVEDYALACYFAELACALADETEENEDLCRVMLLALYALDGGRRDRTLVKAALEWRLAALGGYLPQIAVCGVCGAPQREMPRFFSVRNGAGACESCARRVGGYAHLTDGCRRALYHALSAPPEKLFSFSLEGEAGKQFCTLAEQYVQYHLERSFDSLKFYHSLPSPGLKGG